MTVVLNWQPEGWTSEVIDFALLSRHECLEAPPETSRW
jgi:hypothetical protein